MQIVIIVVFLSTLSLRRATPHKQNKRRYTPYFYPRSPCGERPDNLGTRFCEYCISIHALLAESDLIISVLAFVSIVFLSTLSLRRATDNLGTRFCEYCISIHALLAESDYLTNYHFTVILTFLSTLSLRRATWDWFFTGTLDPKFLSTLSLRRATVSLYVCAQSVAYFYPRSPCGERRKGRSSLNGILIFLSTLSLRRATMTPM